MFAERAQVRPAVCWRRLVPRPPSRRLIPPKARPHASRELELEEGADHFGDCEVGRFDEVVEVPTSTRAHGREDASRQARGRDVTFVLSSDAHQHDELERLRWAANNALRAWVPPERIANSWPRERFLAWVGRRRGARA